MSIRDPHRSRLLVCVLVLLALSFGASARADDDDVPPVPPGTDGTEQDALRAAALDVLRATYHGVRVSDEGDSTRIYGKPMTTGATPDEAVATWLLEHGEALGVPACDLELLFSGAVRFGKFIVFGYRQRIDGMPVLGSRARILVADGETWRVVYAAAAGVARRPRAGFPPLVIAADAALAIARKLPANRDLDLWGAPERVVYVVRDRAGAAHATRAWKIAARSSDRARERSVEILVDGATGALLEIRDVIQHAEVTGVVSGMATPGTSADYSGNTPEEFLLPGVRVQRLSGAGTTYTEADGSYILSGLPSGALTIEAALTGPWANVISVLGAEEVLTDGVSGSATVDFFFNADSESLITAQVNGLIHAQGTHDFYKERFPDYDGIDSVIDCYVNIDFGACNAYFDPFDKSVNFYTAGSDGFETCRNTAFSSVVSHEYGHFVVDSLGLPQGAFGEGFADSLSVLRLDDGVIGRQFYSDGGSVRNIETADQQYPCSSPVPHTCGQVLAGVWWDMRGGFGDALGDAEGLAETQQLFVDWSAITVGTTGSNTAAEWTAIEVLTVDDDDGNIDNGTPNRSTICDAFDAHSIDCPELVTIEFSFPDGIPEFLALDGSTTFRVNVDPVEGEPADGTGLLFYSTNDGAFEEISLTPVGTNEYEAEIPVEDCGDRVRFYVSAEDTLGNTVKSPGDAPGESYVARVGTGVEETLADTFELSSGWTVGDDSDPDDADTGVWTRVDPIGTIAQPELDHTTGTGTKCWVTGQGTAFGFDGDADVDAGKTTLMSPLLDLSADGEYYISYWRWYSNDMGAAPGADTFKVDICNDDGISGDWVNVETIGPTGSERLGGWLFHAFRVSDFVEPTGDVRLRFVAEDAGAASLIEAAVDDFLIEHLTCGPAPVEFVRGDCNASGRRDISDPIHLLKHIFEIGDVVVACEDACDADDGATLNIVDVLKLLSSLFEGTTLPGPFPECGVDGGVDGLECGAATPGCAP